MSHRSLHRAAALSMAALLLSAGIAAADDVAADGDVLTSQTDATVHLGVVDPGAEVSVDVRFVLTCAGLSHVDPGQSIALTFGGGSQSGDGQIVSVGSATLDPIEGDWAVDDEGCPTPAPSTDNGSWSRVTLRAPTVPGKGYPFTISWDRVLSPEGANDDQAIGRTPTTVDFTLDVRGNTAPTLLLPDPFSVEGDTTGGWTADWSGVGATDPEDSPDPTPSCVPAAGDVLPLGTTTVSCSVTDTDGRSDTGSFEVTVVDTTPPTLTAMPADQTLTTSDPTGTTISYPMPIAADVVDASPTVDCVPASGSHLGRGTTTVTCTATDDSGKSSSDTFAITVRYATAHTATATWLEPVGSGGTFGANRGRSVPVKLRLTVDGSERGTGDARLSLVACGGAATTSVGLVYSGGRWNTTLDTARLADPCYVVSATIDGLTAGSFTLELRGSVATSTTATPRR
ncbi:MAG TPA: HYR domain-containing protein [Candidatus Limnocylindrales bacterium]|nr:HYR domain-containing protein [Candidatus Limnocylindrales bacterium]